MKHTPTVKARLFYLGSNEVGISQAAGQFLVKAGLFPQCGQTQSRTKVQLRVCTETMWTQLI